MKNKKEKIKQLKNNKGITLVALVVTIIVLIILAGVSINLVLGDNGIITKAREAAKVQELAQIKSDIQLEIVGKQLSNNGEITENELKEILEKRGTLTSEENILDRTLKTTDGAYEIKVSEIYNGKLLNVEPIIPEQPTIPEEPTIPEGYTAYTIGQEVTIGTETFYVLEDSSETKETVKLFAKYNLNKAGTAQAPNANFKDTACVFSSDNYWSEEDLNVTPKFNLNTYEPVIRDTGSTVYKAKSYATTVLGETAEAEGRLLTYEEATSLETAISTDTTGKIAEMLWGQANTQEKGNFLYYWLGSAYNTNDVCTVGGDVEVVKRSAFGTVNNNFGVRPVIEVSKAAI